MPRDEEPNGTVISALEGRQRPFLLPYNRRLRHLLGITLRNLSLDPPSSSRKTRSTDDESIILTWKSPAKLLAQRSIPRLEHSRSSADLSREATKQDGSPTKPGGSATEGVQTRPLNGRLRRRSTLNWVGASPGARQKKLEDVVSSHMADTFFSIHCEGIEVPIYVSEVIPKAMNPNFRFFDLNSWGPYVTRQDELTVRFWVKSDNMDDFVFLIELKLSLRSLLYMGKSLANFHHPLPKNCIIFHLPDGVYTNLTDMPPEEPPVPLSIDIPLSIADHTESTSTFDQLMRLSTLDDCVQDALATRAKIAAQIEAILDHTTEGRGLEAEAAVAQARLLETQTAVESQRVTNLRVHEARIKAAASIKARREAIVRGRGAQKRAQVYLTEAAEKLRDNRIPLQKINEDITGQRRRICEDLSEIYPIEPIMGQPLHFKIRGLRLPNSKFEGVNDEEVSAALGHVAHVVIQLQAYLSIPLIYPVKMESSTSYIQDPIAVMSGSRTFPLYMRNSVPYRFEYGVFLLNKNIESLMSRHSLKALDIRHTLPNLKYLLYVLTAGTGDMPARKSGGVRALLVGKGTPPVLSRESSQDRGLTPMLQISEEGREINESMGGANGKGTATGGNAFLARSNSPIPTSTTSALRQVF